MLAWLREVFAGMRERRLPGETEWLREEERDGEVRRYRVWASPHLPAEVRRFPGARQVVWVEREVVHKGSGEVKRGERYGVIPFYANSLTLGHQWNRVCRLRISGSWARTRHRSATASIISSRSRKYRLATTSFTKGHTRSTGCSSGL